MSLNISLHVIALMTVRLANQELQSRFKLWRIAEPNLENGQWLGVRFAQLQGLNSYVADIGIITLLVLLQSILYSI
jgi:hypothetical protein